MNTPSPYIIFLCAVSLMNWEANNNKSIYLKEEPKIQLLQNIFVFA